MIVDGAEKVVVLDWVYANADGQMSRKHRRGCSLMATLHWIRLLRKLQSVGLLNNCSALQKRLMQ